MRLLSSRSQLSRLAAPEHQADVVLLAAAPTARNFLLLNVPYFDRSPVSELLMAAHPSRLPMNDSIRVWNERLAEYAAEMPGKYPEAHVELYDVASWLDETLAKVEASGALVADTWCAAYEPVSWQVWPDVPEDYSDSSCPVPVRSSPSLALTFPPSTSCSSFLDPHISSRFRCATHIAVVVDERSS